MSAEYIPGTINIPKNALESRIDELDKSKAIIVYCRSGGRSSAAKNTLAQYDFTVYNMLGGITAWKEKFDTSTSTSTDAEIPSPSVLPEHTPAPSPATSLALTPRTALFFILLVRMPPRLQQPPHPRFDTHNMLKHVALAFYPNRVETYFRSFSFPSHTFSVS